MKKYNQVNQIPGPGFPIQNVSNAMKMPIDAMAFTRKIIKIKTKILPYTTMCG